MSLGRKLCRVREVLERVVNGFGQFISITVVLCSVTLTLLITSSFAQTVSFNGIGTFPVGDQQGNNLATVSDFNNDGVLDLAVVNDGSDDISILLGQSNGMFQPEIRVSLGSGFFSPASPTIGDFNKDGKQDLAVGSSLMGSGDIIVLLGNGNGTFGPGARFAVGSFAFSVAVSDLNRDGNPDLVAANSGSGDVSVLLGLGNGQFGPHVRFDVGSEPQSIAKGDFDRDGIPDIVTANSGSNDVSVLLGLGDGNFSPEIRSSVEVSPFNPGPISVAVGDLNGDGIEDLAVANFNTSDVSVFLGFGDGTFFPPNRFFTSSTGLPSNPTSVSIEDFNRDGNPDLAFANVHQAECSVLLGLGDGTFLEATCFGTGAAPRSLALGDFNRDGKPDLATVNADDDNVSVLLNTIEFISTDIPVIDFMVARSFSSGQKTTSVIVADFDCDGKPDLATANRDDDNISVFLGDGTGSFNSQLTFTVADEPRSLAAGDVDRNGIPDLIVANFGSGNVSVLRGDGTGSFNPSLTFSVGDDPISLGLGDVDNNGTLDMVVAHYFDREIHTLLGNGSGSFYTPADLLPNSVFEYLMKSVAIGDLNRDGILDLATALESLSTEDAINIQVGNGRGSFGIVLAEDIVAGSSAFPIGGNWHKPESVVIGDLNRDGIPDLATAAGGGISFITLLGQGDSVYGPLFGSPNDLVIGNKPFSIVIADFNLDGIPDLAGTNFLDNTVAVLAGDGTGSFEPVRTFDVGAGPTSTAVGDFNRDGRLDLAVANQSDGTISILLNRVPDQDNDGIADEVDTEPLNFSNDFSDEDIGGTTTGIITGRGNQFLSIIEEPNPEGTRITADPSGGPIAATISICGGIASLSFDREDEAVVTCTSLETKAINGIVQIDFADPYFPARVNLHAGNSITFDPTADILTASASNSTHIVLIIRGRVISVQPGETIEVPKQPWFTRIMVRVIRWLRDIPGFIINNFFIIFIVIVIMIGFLIWLLKIRRP